MPSIDPDSDARLPRRSILRGGALASGGLLAGCLDSITDTGPTTEPGPGTNPTAEFDPETSFFVAPDGDDSNEGTMDAPFGSLEAARDAVRSLKEEDGLPEGGVSVEIRGGQYERRSTFNLEADDSGTEESPIVWRAYEDEVPVLTGGTELDNDAFEPISGDARSRIPEEARGEVVQIDLEAQGITDYGEIKPTGFRQPSRPDPATLYFEGERQTLARYPNEGFVQTTSGPGWDPSTNITFGYADDRVETWESIEGVWVWGHFRNDWSHNTASLQSIDPDNDTLTTGNENIEYGIWEDRPYYYFNVLDELNSPGEWYLDRDEGMLYFYPPADIGDATVELSLFAEPLFELIDTTHLTVAGLEFRTNRSQGIIAGGIQDVAIRGCHFSQFGQHGILIHHGAVDAPEDFIGDPPPTGRSAATGDSPLAGATQMSKRVTIDGCTLRGFSDTAIHFEVGNQYKLEPGNSVIKNCDISEPGQRTTVAFDGVENTFKHNRMHHFPGLGVAFSGNDHVFEYNEVDHGCLRSGDTGAFYTYKSMENRGSIFRYNYIHDIQQGVPAGTGGAGEKFQAGIYFDSHASGYEAHNNVFVNCDQGFHANGGRSLNVHDNLLIMCDWAIEFNDWWVGEEECMGQSELWGQLQKIPYTEGEWAERYPNLANIMNDDPCTWGKYNSITNNVAFRCGVGTGNANPFSSETEDVPQDTIGVDPTHAEYATVENNFITGEDPGFADSDAPTFKFADDSEVFEQIPEWEQFPIDQVGLQVDERIASRRGITTLPDAGSVLADIVIGLNNPSIEGILPVDATNQLNVAVYSYTGDELDIPREDITFWSRDPAIATIDETGTVTAVGTGHTALKATVEYENHQVSHEIPIEVVEQTPEGEPLAGTDLRTFASTDANFSADDGTLTIEANGNAIWSFADTYGAIFNPDSLGETGSVTVKLTEFSVHGDHTKVGLMVRNTIPGSSSSTGYVLLHTDSNNGIQLTWDSDTDGMIDSWENGESFELPTWLKLERDGSTFTGYQSSDGSNWTEVASVEMGSAQATMDAGIFANSNNENEMTTAVFEDFQVE